MNKLQATVRLQLHLTENTSPQELKQFLGGVKNTDRIISGCHEGRKVLYAVEHHVGFVHAGARQQASEEARKNINMLFSRWEKDAGGLRNVRLPVTSHSLRGQDVAPSLDSIIQARSTPAAASAIPPWLATPDMSHVPAARASAAFDKIAKQVRKALLRNPQGDAPALAEAANGMGKLFAAELRAAPRDTQFAFATSDGAQFKRELQKALGLDAAQAENPAIARLLERTYHTLVCHLSDRALRNGDLKIDGKAYHFKRPLYHQAGKAKVDLYACGKSLVAVKQDLEHQGSEEKILIDAARKEARLQRHAMGSGQSRVLPLLGVVRTKKGEFLIATAFAPHGDANRIGEKIAKALKQGRITPRQADLVRLTLLRDMLAEVSHLHAKRKISHFDIKPGNFFFDNQSKARLADFGTARMGMDGEVRSVPVDNPLWLAPEAIEGNDNIRAGKARMQKEMKETEEQIKAMENLSLKEKSALMAEFREEAGKKDAGLHYTISGKADVWSMGVSAFELWYGRLPFPPDKFMSTTQKNILDYSRLDSREERMAQLRLGSSLIDAWIGDMLDPDPRRRPDLDAALRSRIFADPEVGSPAIRKLMTQLATTPLGE